MNNGLGFFRLSMVVALGISVAAMGNEVNHMNPKEELFEGARMGSVTLIESALLRGADCNAKNSDGMTALQVASYEGKVDCLSYLMSRGADVRSRDDYGNTLLHSAALGGNLECLRVVLANPEIAIDGLEIVSRGANTALSFAALRGHLDCLKELLSKGARIEVCETHYMGTADTFRSTALHSAAAGGSLDCIRELLSRGADVKMVDSIDRTALHCAAYRGHLDCLKVLLDWDKGLEIKSTYGTKALHFAAQGGSIDCIRELLTRGADVEAKDEEGNTALHFAAQRGSIDCIRELLTRGAVVEAKNAQGNTALHCISNNYHTDECLNELLSRGAQLEDKNYRGETVLHIAVMDNESDCMKDLLKRGAFFDIQDTSCRKGLLRGLMYCDVDFLRVFLLIKAQILMYGSSCHVLAPPKEQVLASRRRLKAGLLCLRYAQSDSTTPKLEHPAGTDISSNKHLYSELFLSHSSTREDALILLMDAMAKGKNVDYPLFNHAIDYLSEYLVSKLSQLLEEMRDAVLVGPSQELRTESWVKPKDKEELLMLVDLDSTKQIFHDLIAKALRVRFRELMSPTRSESSTKVFEHASQSTPWRVRFKRI